MPTFSSASPTATAPPSGANDQGSYSYETSSAGDQGSYSYDASGDQGSYSYETSSAGDQGSYSYDASGDQGSYSYETSSYDSSVTYTLFEGATSSASGADLDLVLDQTFWEREYTLSIWFTMPDDLGSIGAWDALLGNEDGGHPYPYFNQNGLWFERQDGPFPNTAGLNLSCFDAAASYTASFHHYLEGGGDCFDMSVERIGAGAPCPPVSWCFDYDYDNVPLYAGCGYGKESEVFPGSVTKVVFLSHWRTGPAGICDTDEQHWLGYMPSREACIEACDVAGHDAMAWDSNMQQCTCFMQDQCGCVESADDWCWCEAKDVYHGAADDYHTHDGVYYGAADDYYTNDGVYYGAADDYYTNDGGFQPWMMSEEDCAAHGCDYYSEWGSYCSCEDPDSCASAGGELQCNSFGPMAFKGNNSPLPQECHAFSYSYSYSFMYDFQRETTMLV